MRRTIGAMLVAAVVGSGAGFVAGMLTDPDARTSSSTSPVAASSPSVPSDVEEPYAKDIDFPTLAKGLTYHQETIGSAPFDWNYVVPNGWESTRIASEELSWSAPDNPQGSYGMRIEMVESDRGTPEQLVAAKLAALEEAQEDLEVLDKTSDTLAISYRSKPEGWLRFNTFRWFTRPGSEAAAVELAVNGRRGDRPAMNEVLARISEGVEPAS